MEEPLDILLYGLGAVGSVYAFVLNRCKNVRLSACCRSNFEAVKQNGISLSSVRHGDHVFHPHRVVQSPEEAGITFDYILCVNKAIDLKTTATSLAPAVDPKRTAFVIIQNGVGNEDPFRATFPECTILTCATWIGATQVSPGVIEHIKSPDLTEIGLFPNDSKDPEKEQRRLNEFVSLLEEGKTPCSVPENIQLKRWEKVVFNSAWNALTALTLQDTHAWLNSTEEAMPMTRRVMEEVVAVGRKCGMPLKDEVIDRSIEVILKIHPGPMSSMQMDAQHGRPMEVEVILGSPVQKGRELGVSVPTLETLYILLSSINSKIIKAGNA